MLFHKNDRNKFVTAGKKLDTKTFESITKFFEAQFNQNKNHGMLEHMELKRIKKHAHLKMKNKLHDKIVRARMSIAHTKWSTTSLHAMPNAAL